MLSCELDITLTSDGGGGGGGGGGGLAASSPTPRTGCPESSSAAASSSDSASASAAVGGCARRIMVCPATCVVQRRPPHDRASVCHAVSQRSTFPSASIYPASEWPRRDEPTRRTTPTMSRRRAQCQVNCVRPVVGRDPRRRRTASGATTRASGPRPTRRRRRGLRAV